MPLRGFRVTFVRRDTNRMLHEKIVSDTHSADAERHLPPHRCSGRGGKTDLRRTRPERKGNVRSDGRTRRHTARHNARRRLRDADGGAGLLQPARGNVYPGNPLGRRARLRKFDTAAFYGNEKEVGEALRRSGIPRRELFVATKLYPNRFFDAENAIEESLRKLDIGYIDLMLLHHPGAHDTKAYRAMERAVEAGTIRSLGLSNYYIAETRDFLPRTKIGPVLVQNEIHPYYRDRAVREFLQRHGIAVEAWYPLGGRGYTACLLGNGTVGRIARRHGRSPAQVILRWNLQSGVAVVPGSSDPVHQKENISLFDFCLTSEEMAAIDALDRNEKHDWY